ncbi:MAG TPA: precorrin-3B C(17)-methyltransferase [Methanosarcinales archaeon]|nr:precorrin-3B C(17)-methyltransferase [Methanosarcinales archaeon]
MSQLPLQNRFKNAINCKSHIPPKLYVVGIGPGYLEYMTVKAIEVLLASDYIIGNGFYIDLIERLIIRQEVKVIKSEMGKEVERATLAVNLAEDNVVSIISGGDANLYGMAGLVLEVAENTGSNVEIEIVPGVTAATAAASVLGAPMANDVAIISLSDLLIPWQKIEKRIINACKGDFIIALYNPKSKKRNENFIKAIEIMKKYKQSTTPVGIAKNVMRDGEKIIITTLTDVLDYNEEIDMRTTVLIGNSSSRIWQNKIITQRGYHHKYKY